MLPKPAGNFPAPENIVVWLSDTGTALHLVGEKNLSTEELSRVRKISAITLHTPNGPTTANRAIDFWLPALDINISALVLKDSPNALSVGKIVRESGLDFFWSHQEPDVPTYILPDGSLAEHVVQFDTPSINIREMPSPAECCSGAGEPRQSLGCSGAGEAVPLRAAGTASTHSYSRNIRELFA